MFNINNLINKNWYFQGFNGVPGILCGPAWSMVRDMPNFLGYGYSVCIEYFSNDVCYYLYSWDDLYKIHDELLKRFYKDKKYLKFLLDSDRKICKQVLADYLDLGKRDWDTATVEQLFAGWRLANDLYAHLLSVSHIVEGFTLTTEDNIRDLINHEFPGNSEALFLLSTPPVHSFMSTEHYELCLIARYIKKLGWGKVSINKILSNKKIIQKIADHQKKYFWKLNSYTTAKYLDDSYFIKEIFEFFVKKIDFEKFIKDYEGLPKRMADRRILLKKNKNKELFDLLTIADTIFIIHDRRKEHMTKAITYLEKILSEIAKRFQVPLDELHYILPSELEQLPKILPELKRRREHSVYILFPGGEVPVISGLKAKQYFGKIEYKNNLEKVREIKGNGASPGKVTGAVKVCRGEKELVKMKEGDILVACMTQPEFLPALKKAKAVVTDEGGLTCHAAIVARELGIPCVIGTKVATKILKDGQVVEVDANSGIIKIIK